jgi:hypothetical protein
MTKNSKFEDGNGFLMPTKGQLILSNYKTKHAIRVERNDDERYFRWKTKEKAVAVRDESSPV